jgi:lysozyme
MKLGLKGLHLIKEFEGLRLTAYFDSRRPPIPTIGYGHTKTVTKQDVLNKKTITQTQADQLLVMDSAEAQHAVNKFVQVPVNQNMYDALVSFTFNLGGGALANSTLLKLLNAKNYRGAADQFLRWNKEMKNGVATPSAGLTRRRNAERDLFLQQ